MQELEPASTGAIRRCIEVDFHYSGFEWVDFHDVGNSVIAFLRRGEDPRGFPAVLLQLHSGSPGELRIRRARRGLLRRGVEYGLGAFGGSNVTNGNGVPSSPTRGMGDSTASRLLSHRWASRLSGGAECRTGSTRLWSAAVTTAW